MILEDLKEEFPEEEFMIADGFDDAIVGVEKKTMRVIYSISKCLEILMEEGLNMEDAIEYFSYDIEGAYVGEKTPIWCDDNFI